MGVISQSIQDNHPFIWNGGLAAEMSQIRFPTLNVLDAIYVNPHPMENGNAGPNTPYASAVKTNRIAAGLDPVAIDYWASKNILLPVARSLGYASFSSLDPDTPNGLLHNTLTNSMNILRADGRQATMDPSQITVCNSYPSIQEDLPNFSAFSENTVYFVYPDYGGFKPAGVGYAWLSDWTATGFLVGMCSNRQHENTDTNSTMIDTTCGAVKLRDATVVLFGGPKVNAPVHYYESNRMAPLYFHEEGGTCHWYRSDGMRIDETALPSSQLSSQDMFVVESFIDGSGNMVFIIYGYGWKGTFAGGKFFKFVMYPNIGSYTASHYVYKWNDSNNDGFVDMNEISTIPIAQG